MVAVLQEIEDFDEYRTDYTVDVDQMLNDVFNKEVLTALKFLRGSSGLDISSLTPLKDPEILKIVIDGLSWFNENYENLPHDILLEFDPDYDEDEDSDYTDSEDEDTDDTDYTDSEDEDSDDDFDSDDDDYFALHNEDGELW